ncbi:thioesterase II family protein [Plantactinospora endophytica]|uniref:Oleoyl-ACP hydrolase n=1 Tax=Plantactinospora endophytica TaxID=673535 RepID=A0ABQ4EFW7_9ACTN|nr:alpha/beta fold hydrolase [Plantactinospora endophytica]GIG93137.1 oleoyl-ACP hydrolase [Plantactinospora endophytica]
MSAARFRLVPPDGVGPTVLAFPHAGGGGDAFRPVAERLGPGLRLRTTQLPGREHLTGRRPYLAMDDLVNDLVPAASGAVAFFGHSMGAFVAVALAIGLADRGLPVPSALVLAGAGAPDRRDPADDVHRLGDEQLLARVHDYGGTAPELLTAPAMIRSLLPALRSDFTLFETWRPDRPKPLETTLTVLAGADDAFVSPFQLEGWSAHSSRPVSYHRLPGGHFFFRDEADATARILRTAVVRG